MHFLLEIKVLAGVPTPKTFGCSPDNAPLCPDSQRYSVSLEPGACAEPGLGPAVVRTLNQVRSPLASHLETYSLFKCIYRKSHTLI